MSHIALLSMERWEKIYTDLNLKQPGNLCAEPARFFPVRARPGQSRAQIHFSEVMLPFRLRIQNEELSVCSHKPNEKSFKMFGRRFFKCFAGEDMDSEKSVSMAYIPCPSVFFATLQCIFSRSDICLFSVFQYIQAVIIKWQCPIGAVIFHVVKCSDLYIGYLNPPKLLNVANRPFRPQILDVL